MMYVIIILTLLLVGGDVLQGDEILNITGPDTDILLPQ